MINNCSKLRSPIYPRPLGPYPSCHSNFPSRCLEGENVVGAPDLAHVVVRLEVLVDAPVADLQSPQQTAQRWKPPVGFPSMFNPNNSAMVSPIPEGVFGT